MISSVVCLFCCMVGSSPSFRWEPLTQLGPVAGTSITMAKRRGARTVTRFPLMRTMLYEDELRWNREVSKQHSRSSRPGL